MGLAANQARLLSLTSRRSDVEFEMQQISNAKMSLMPKLNRINQEYQDAISNTKLFLNTPTGNAVVLTAAALAAQGLYIQDRTGKIVIPNASDEEQLASIPSNSDAIKVNPEPTFETFKTFDTQKINKLINVPKYEEKITIEEVQKYPTRVGTDKEETEINGFSSLKKVLSDNAVNAKNYKEALFENINNGKIVANISNTKGDNVLKTTALNKGSLDMPQDLQNYFNENIATVNNRNFRHEVESLDDLKANGKINKDNVQYVYNAQQFLEALANNTKDDTCNANIVLMNDIDMSEIDLNENNGKQIYGEDTWNKISSLYDFSEVKTNNDINGDGKVDSEDKFKTNFLKINNFNGSIYGQGFAIKNLNIASNTQDNYAAMFDNISKDSVIQDVVVDNAIVLNAGKEGDDNQHASILCKENNGKLKNILANGSQLSLKNSTSLKDSKYGANFKDNTTTSENLAEMLSDLSILQNRSYTDQKGKIKKASGNSLEKLADKYNSGWGIVQTEKRNYNDIKSQNQSYGYNGNFTNDYHTGWDFIAKSNTYNYKSGFGEKSEDNGLTNATQSGFDEKGGDNFRNVYLNGKKNTRYKNTSKKIIYDGLNRISHNDTDNESKTFKYKPNVDSEYFAKNFLFSKNSPISYSVYEDKTGQTVIDKTKANENYLLDGFKEVENSLDPKTGVVKLEKRELVETEEYKKAKEEVELYGQTGATIKDSSIGSDSNKNKNDKFTVVVTGNGVSNECLDELKKYQSDKENYKITEKEGKVLVEKRQATKSIDKTKVTIVKDIDSQLENNIKKGIWVIVGNKQDDSSKLEIKNNKDIGLKEALYKDDDKIAEAKYQSERDKINKIEQKYDMRMSNLETELKSMESMIESTERMIKNNMDGYKSFSH